MRTGTACNAQSSQITQGLTTVDCLGRREKQLNFIRFYRVVGRLISACTAAIRHQPNRL